MNDPIVEEVRRARAEIAARNGHDLNPTSNLVIDMAGHPDGIYHYTSVNIPADGTH